MATIAEARGSDDLLEALAEPLVVDVALFEEGLLDRYLQMRGALLPDDERALAEVCSGSQRTLFEITHMEPSGAVGLRDTRDGTVSEVPTLGTESGQGKVGELLLGRIVPIGDAHRFFGPVLTIPLRLRDSLVALTSGEPDGDDWLEWLAAATAPPTLSNTEGEPLLFCEGRYTVADPQAAGRTLGQAFSEAEADAPERVFHQILDGDQGRWIRGTVTLTDRDLLVQANSEARFTRLSDEVKTLLPDARLVDEHRTSGKEMMSGLDHSQPSPSADPDRHEVVAEFLDDYYMRWLDMEILALGGLTPRQAAVDPTRREDLLLLLDEFESVPGPGVPVTQIRAALSLFSST
jgi:hypothetical protein